MCRYALPRHRRRVDTPACCVDTSVMSRRTVAVGVAAGLLLGGGAVGLAMRPDKQVQGPPAAVRYGNGLEMQSALRRAGVLCTPDMQYTKYIVTTCTMGGRTVNLVSQATGPEPAPRFVPVLTGPNWYISSDRVANLVRIRDAIGGTF